MRPYNIVYVAIAFLVWWAYCGYFLILRLGAFMRGRAKSGVQNPPSKHELPTMTVLVPCYNEEKFIGEKVEDLSKVKYEPEKLEVIFLDGSSTDATVQVIEEKIENLPHFRVIQTGTRGKIKQLNFFLPQAQGEIIVNTDVDGRLEQGGLLAIAREFASDENVGVVGGYVMPAHSSHLEREYWKLQNQARVLEAKAGSASIVVGACYAFRKGLFEKFPENVVADDIYVAFQAASKGKRVVYSPAVKVYELRSARTIGEFVRHKFRKSNAYMLELLRFLPGVFKMPRRWGFIYLNKVLQLLLIPWIVVAFVALMFILVTRYEYETSVLLFILAFSSLFLTNKVLLRIKGAGEEPASVWLGAYAFFISNLVLIGAGLAFPFWRQKSEYFKIGEVARQSDRQRA
jgi:cellulose synthase/poly-beta-1,6-N-acetylglucosamine synthase-like glycosyltransferase